MEQVKANINSRFEEVIKDLWVKNGDQCSVIYAGTGALDGKSKVKNLFALKNLLCLKIEYFSLKMLVVL